MIGVVAATARAAVSPGGADAAAVAAAAATTGAAAVAAAAGNASVAVAAAGGNAAITGAATAAADADASNAAAAAGDVANASAEPDLADRTTNGGSPVEAHVPLVSAFARAWAASNSAGKLRCEGAGRAEPLFSTVSTSAMRAAARSVAKAKAWLRTLMNPVASHSPCG